MLVTRALVERLETVEVETVAGLVQALARTAVDPVPEAEPWGRGLLGATGPRRYVNRAVGVTLDPLTPDEVAGLATWFRDRGLTPAVQLSSSAPASTVQALAGAGFGPAWCRSVLALELTGSPDDGGSPRPGSVEVDVDVDVEPVDVEPVDDDAAARAAAAVMAHGQDDPTVATEFMAADWACAGTTQLLARQAGRAVGCGSVTVVGTTAWLGAAATVPDARGRGVQAALLRHRVRRARAAGCDLVAATASVGSTSARNLQRAGFALVQEQWVVQQAP